MRWSASRRPGLKPIVRRGAARRVDATAPCPVRRALGRQGAILGASLALAACAGSGDEVARQQTAWVADGEPANCISRSQIRSIQVIDDRTIDFEMSGRRTYRNELPFRCFGLTVGSQMRFNSVNSLMRIEAPSTSFLCRVDRFTPRSPGRSPRGAGAGGCQLGMFQPMVRVPVPAVPKPETGEDRP